MSPLVNVARFLPEAASHEPERAAVVIPWAKPAERVTTFRELERDSSAVVRLLHQEGIGRGSRVLVMVRPGLDLIRIVFALFKAGAIPVLIDPGMGVKAFVACVERTRPDALVGIQLAHWVSRVYFRSFTDVRHRVVVGGRGWQRRLDASRTASAGPYQVAATKAEDTAAILFTSGSTGAPKGVCYTHGVFEAQVRLVRDTYSIEPGEIDLPMLPVFALFNPALGMTTVVPQINPRRPASLDVKCIVEAIQDWQVTNSFGSPTLWLKIVRYCARKGITLPSLRRVLVAGAPVSPDLVRIMKQVLVNGELHTPYGATECLPVSTLSGSEILEDTWEKTEQGRGTCVGKVIAGMRAEMIPVTEGKVNTVTSDGFVADGTVGELVVAGPVVTQGYDALPEATERARFVDESGVVWHRMGDLAYRDTDQRLWFCGRLAERVETTRGVLYTDCSEALFNRHPQVLRSALLGLGPVGSQVPILAVEPERGHFPRTRRQRHQLKQELLALAQGKGLVSALRQVVFVTRFPVDVRHNAKIHRLTMSRYFSSRLNAKLDRLRQEFEEAT